MHFQDYSNLRKHHKKRIQYQAEPQTLVHNNQSFQKKKIILKITTNLDYFHLKVENFHANFRILFKPVNKIKLKINKHQIVEINRKKQ